MSKGLEMEEKRMYDTRRWREGYHHADEAKTETRAGPNCHDSQEIQGMGEACVRPREGTFFFPLHNQTLQNMRVYMWGGCISVDQQWAEYHFLAQGKYSNKKIKSWWNYGDTVLGAKIWTGLPTHHQMFPNFFLPQYIFEE